MSDPYSQMAFSLMHYKQDVESKDTQWSADSALYPILEADIEKDNIVNIYKFRKLYEVIRSFKENELLLKFFSTNNKSFTELNNNIKSLTEKISDLKINDHYNIPLSAIYSEKWELTKPPMYISIEKNDKDDFIACLYEADIYGYGNSIPDSVEDFINNLINQYEYLLYEKDSLGEIPKRQLLVLNQLIKGK